MLEIRLSKAANESGGVVKRLPSETVTVACPDYLVISDLHVAKSLGTVNPSSQLKTLGRRSRRQLGQRVHFCVRCDFPIAVYGRLIWELFVNVTGFSWTMLEQTFDLFGCWIRRGVSKTQKKWCKLIPSCIWWLVWKERIGRCFKDRSYSICKVKWNCLVSLYFWCKELCTEDVDQIIELIGSL